MGYNLMNADGETYFDVVMFCAKSQAFFTRNWALQTAKKIDEARDVILGPVGPKRDHALEELRKMKRPRETSGHVDGVAQFLIMVDMSLPLWGLKSMEEGPSEISRASWTLTDAATADELVEPALDELLDGTGDGNLDAFWEFHNETPMPPHVLSDRHLSVVPDLETGVEGDDQVD